MIRICYLYIKTFVYGSLVHKPTLFCMYSEQAGPAMPQLPEGYGSGNYHPGYNGAYIPGGGGVQNGNSGDGTYP
jgi:hypothetical protein